MKGFVLRLIPASVGVWLPLRVLHRKHAVVRFFQVDLPPFVEMEITYTEPGVKGDTATNTLKPATVETGAEVMVPMFINEGDVIRVSTADRSYSERVKQ